MAGSLSRRSSSADQFRNYLNGNGNGHTRLMSSASHNRGFECSGVGPLGAVPSGQQCAATSHVDNGVETIMVHDMSSGAAAGTRGSFSASRPPPGNGHHRPNEHPTPGKVPKSRPRAKSTADAMLNQVKSLQDKRGLSILTHATERQISV